MTAEEEVTMNKKLLSAALAGIILMTGCSDNSTSDDTTQLTAEAAGTGLSEDFLWVQ